MGDLQSGGTVEKLEAELARERAVLEVYGTVLSRHQLSPRALRAAARISEIEAQLGRADGWEHRPQDTIEGVRTAILDVLGLPLNCDRVRVDRQARDSTVGWSQTGHTDLSVVLDEALDALITALLEQKHIKGYERIPQGDDTVTLSDGSVLADLPWDEE